MKSHLRFHQLTIEICADDIRRFLQGRPRSSLTQIMEHVCGGFARLAGTQRLKLWTEVRAILHRMEEKGIVRCLGEMGGNTWSLVEADNPDGAGRFFHN